MASTYKILGQVTGSSTNTNLYTVPAATQAVISSLTIANRDSANGSYRIMAIPSGSSLANQHYLAYGVAIGANDTIAYTIGISLNAGDKLDVWATGSSAGNNISFSVFGAEVQ